MIRRAPLPPKYAPWEKKRRRIRLLAERKIHWRERKAHRHLLDMWGRRLRSAAANRSKLAEIWKSDVKFIVGGDFKDRVTVHAP